MFGIGKDRTVQEGLYALSLSILVSTIVISFSMIYSANILAGNVIPGIADMQDQQAQPQGQDQGQEGDAVQVSADNDPAIGKANAPVIMIQFSEFQCPFSGRFARDTLPSIKEDYIDTGKVRFVYRDFTVHSTSQKAQEAAECAKEQGKFWEYHDILYENQGNVSDVDSLKQFAADLGLDTLIFNACLDTDKYAGEVVKDTNDGRSYGITGTPSFFINGKKFVGAQPYEKFQAELDAALAG